MHQLLKKYRASRDCAPLGLSSEVDETKSAFSGDADHGLNSLHEVSNFVEIEDDPSEFENRNRFDENTARILHFDKQLALSLSMSSSDVSKQKMDLENLKVMDGFIARRRHKADYSKWFRKSLDRPSLSVQTTTDHTSRFQYHARIPVEPPLPSPVDNDETKTEDLLNLQSPFDVVHNGAHAVQSSPAKEFVAVEIQTDDTYVLISRAEQISHRKVVKRVKKEALEAEKEFKKRERGILEDLKVSKSSEAGLRAELDEMKKLCQERLSEVEFLHSRIQIQRAESEAHLQEEMKKRDEEEWTKALTRGSVFIKHGRRGKPHLRFVYCDESLRHVFYARLDSHQVDHGKLELSKVKDIAHGHKTPIFKKSSHPETVGACFSLIWEDYTLNLELPSYPKDMDAKLRDKLVNDRRKIWLDAFRWAVAKSKS